MGVGGGGGWGGRWRGGGCRVKTKVFGLFLSVEMCQCCHFWVQWVFIALLMVLCSDFVSVAHYISCG